MEIKLKNRKIVKQGESHFIYIPKAFIDNGQVDVDETYEVTIKSQKKNKNPESITSNQEQTMNI